MRLLLSLLLSTLLWVHAGIGGVLPDPRLTPGDVFDVSAVDLCVAGYAKKVRHVTQSTKRAVFSTYGVAWQDRSGYEVDHLISLELGGSNSTKNLWPQPYGGTYNARQKDALENRLHLLVCRGQLDLKTAQRAVARDWVNAYRKYVHP
jgi:hypothetical protein